MRGTARRDGNTCDSYSPDGTDDWDYKCPGGVMVATHDSNSCAVKGVSVRLRPGAQERNCCIQPDNLSSTRRYYGLSNKADCIVSHPLNRCTQGVNCTPIVSPIGKQWNRRNLTIPRSRIGRCTSFWYWNFLGSTPSAGANLYP